MDPEHILAGTASLFTALGDKTRLRLLNLMRDREICVSNFTGTLGHSQPLISRHLAYLRNSGIVEARRDGKWMHYSIARNLDPNTDRLLSELFKWMEDQDGLRVDREKYRTTYNVDVPPEIAPNVDTKKSTQAPRRAIKRAVKAKPEVVEQDPEPVFEPEPAAYEASEPDYDVRHNELEDFLL
jgi:DNA-binding transcriptional ArsR family regulator